MKPGELFQKETLPGRATAAGTAYYFEDATRSFPEYKAELWHARAGSLPYTVSRLGFGGYRVTRGVRPQFDALREALLTGTNVIDTSSNYGDGASESLIGDVLRELTAAGRLRRDQVVVVSKIGYIQGTRLKEYRAEPRQYPEVVRYSRSLCHCIAPAFLRDQLRMSLRRLGLETLDVLLLHNPEFFLIDAERTRQEAGRARAEYERRLAAAFACMEELVAEGLITAYGVSSNTMAAPAETYTATHLQALVELAGEHFRVIQFPGNLIENDFMFSRRAGGGALGQQIQAAKLWALLNRPLNATGPDQALFRLARMVEYPPDEGAGIVAEMNRLLGTIRDTEDRLRTLHAERRFQFDERTPALSGLFQTYRGRIGTQDHLFHSLPALSEMFQRTINYLKSVADTDPRRYALENYTRQGNRLLALWDRYIAARHHNRARRLEEALAASSPALAERPLAVQALLFLLAVRFPQTVLVGMRRREYVEQLRQVYSVPPPAETELLGIVGQVLDMVLPAAEE